MSGKSFAGRQSATSKPTVSVPSLPNRREALAGTGILVFGLTFLAAAMRSPAATQSKMSKAQANYRETPQGDERCANCVHFVAEENACNLVEGEIDADAWCQLWMPEG